MWGFAADEAAEGLCRGYASALGHLPTACLTRSGTPALAMTAILVLAAFVLIRILLTAWQRR